LSDVHEVKFDSLLIIQRKDSKIIENKEADKKKIDEPKYIKKKSLREKTPTCGNIFRSSIALSA
jgi:hypothetical protein